MKVKARIWMESDKGLLLGKGRYALLRAIERFGSINRAAKEMQLSYKKAWRQVNDINANAREKVVIRVSGGKGGGGTRLTAYGKALLAAFDEMDRACAVFLEQQLERSKAIN